MDFVTAVRRCFSQYATFTGRARRAEFWWFALFYFIANIVLSVIDATFFGFGHGMMGGYQLLSGLFGLAMFVPSLAVSVRRLHDTGKSGWWVLIAFIPIIGFFLLLYWYVRPGDPHPNAYGPDPIEDQDGDLDGYDAKSPIPRVTRH